MTKRLKVWLIAALAAVCAACIPAGCSVGEPGREEVLKGYSAHVTYYANGGYFDSSTTLNVRELYFENNPSADNYNAAGVPFFDISESTPDMKVSRRGYDLVGWYMPATYTEGAHSGEIKYIYTEGETTYAVYPVYEKDESGNIVTDDGVPRIVTDPETDKPVFARANADGNGLKDEMIKESSVMIEPSATPVPVDKLIAHDQNMIVCAVWRPSLKIEYKLSCEEGKVYQDEAGNSYRNGDVLRSDNFGKGDTSSPATGEPITLIGATFTRTYSNEACTETTEVVARPEGENPANPVLWSKYIDGNDWKVIKNDPSDVVAMFNGLTMAGNKFYLLDDVDCSRQSINLKNSMNNMVTVATIEGNGRTLSNLNFKVSGIAGNGAILSPLGDIGAAAKIKNLTLKNVNIEITGRGDLSVYGVCNSFNASAEVTGLIIDGVKATVTNPSDYKVNGLTGVTGVATTPQWLFGGSLTDADFLAAHTGFEVKGDENTLTINH